MKVIMNRYRFLKEALAARQRYSGSGGKNETRIYFQ
jgi:hypothetical protein